MHCIEPRRAFVLTRLVQKIQGTSFGGVGSQKQIRSIIKADDAGNYKPRGHPQGKSVGNGRHVAGGRDHAMKALTHSAMREHVLNSRWRTEGCLFGLLDGL